MKNATKAAGLRYFTATCLTLVIFANSSLFIFAAPGSAYATAEIAISGTAENGVQPVVKINGEQAVSGRTFVSGGVVETSNTAFANISLGKLGRIGLSPNSVLSLSFTGDTISGNLSAGKITVFSAEGVSVNIITPDNAFLNDKNFKGNFTIDLASGVSAAAAEAGTLNYANGSPAAKAQTTDDDDEGGLLLPLAIFAGAVGAAVVYVLINRNDDDERGVIVSPVR
ncbi:MAG: hypothetical protein WKF92_14640 [Pyrinomonadaceae bacterium]